MMSSFSTSRLDRDSMRNWVRVKVSKDTLIAKSKKVSKEVGKRVRS